MKNSLKNSMKNSLKESTYLNASNRYAEKVTSPLKKSNYVADQDYKDYLYKSTIRADKSAGHSKMDSLRLKESFSPQKSYKDSDLDGLHWSFKQAILDERAIEDVKERLVQRSDFNAFDAFRVFDYKGRGMISYYEFLQFLRDFGVYEDEKSVLLLFNKLDINFSDAIEFSEFQFLIEPLSRQFAQILKDNKPQYIKNQLDFSMDTNRIYRQLLNLQIQKEKHFEELRLQMNIQYLNKQKAFRYLDNMNKNYLTKQDFKVFLEEFHFYPTQQDLKSLFDRFDTDLNGKISYQDFVKELEPKRHN